MALDGKVALVTGAAQGLGKSFSDILLKNGAKVALLDVNEAVGKDLKASLDKEFGEDRTVFLTCDVTSDEQLKDAFRKTIERFNKIDIVCNNAGVMDENNWEKTVAINLNGVVRGTYLALQHMKETGSEGGLIINVASLAGLGPLITFPIYTATKYGVVGFSRALAEASKVSGYGVRINVLCPSFAKTPLLSFRDNKEQAGQFADLMGITDQLIEKFGLLEVSTVAESFLQLVTDESKNGAVLTVTKEGAAYMDYSDRILDMPKTAVPSSLPLTESYMPSQ